MVSFEVLDCRIMMMHMKHYLAMMPLMNEVKWNLIDFGEVKCERASASVGKKEKFDIKITEFNFSCKCFYENKTNR